MGKFNEEMARAGVMLAGEGLHPSAKGARIRYSRGKITVLDRQGLEASACECYRIIRQEYVRLLAGK